MIPYFKAGLENHEFCRYVASRPLSAQEVRQALGAAIPDFDHYLDEGQIEIIPHADWLLKEGRFDSHRVIQGYFSLLASGENLKPGE